MSDPFELLGLPRRPWLEERVIRTAFQEKARRSHPDADGGSAEIFTKLNAAQAIVADPASRLRLLAGDAPIPAMPSDIQLGFRVAEMMRKVEALRENERGAGNVLVRALLAKDAASVRLGLDEIVAILESEKAMLEARLRELDHRWPDVPVGEVATLAGEYIFLSRWRAQTKEAELALQIAFGRTGESDNPATAGSPQNGGKRSVVSDFPIGRKRPVHCSALETFNRTTAILVTCCTQNRKPILARPEIHDLLRRVWLEADAWWVGQYVLMPDHLHFFARPGSLDAAPLARWVQYWKGMASRQWPHPHEQPVWQIDFWDTQMRNRTHYSEKWEYVRNNPVRHGLCSKAEVWPFQGEIRPLEWHE